MNLTPNIIFCLQGESGLAEPDTTRVKDMTAINSVS